MKRNLILSLLCIAASTTAFGGPAKSKDHDHAPPKVSQAFEDMKALLGTWNGTTKMEGKEMPITVTYTLTSGGTTLVETMNPGTPHEMITLYANRGKQVNATHYCMLGNQPQMKLKKSEKNQFVFEMEGNQGISNKKEMHMRAVTLTLNGNQLKQDWTNYKDGKKNDHAIFEFTKKN